MTQAILFITLALAGLLAMLFIVGLLLPRTLVDTQAATIGRPVDDVWRAITDYESQPSWHPELEAIDPLPPRDDRRRWRERHTNGESNVVEEFDVDPPRRVVWRFEEAHHAFRGEWAVSLERLGEDGTRLEIEQRAEIPSPLARVAARFIVGRDSFLKLYLASLAVHLESGEDEA